MLVYHNFGMVIYSYIMIFLYCLFYSTVLILNISYRKDYYCNDVNGPDNATCELLINV